MVIQFYTVVPSTSEPSTPSPKAPNPHSSWSPQLMQVLLVKHAGFRGPHCWAPWINPIRYYTVSTGLFSLGGIERNFIMYNREVVASHGCQLSAGRIIVDEWKLPFGFPPQGLIPQFTILVGGIPTPLKNDGVRQLGWWNSQYMEK